MALYPSYADVPYRKPVEMNFRFKTLFSNYDSEATEQRKRKQQFPKIDVAMDYSLCEREEMAELYNFYIARQGQYGSFHWIDIDYDDYEGLYFATGDGVETTFDLPGANTSAQTVYGDYAIYNQAADATSAGDYYISDGSGVDGGDQAIFFVPVGEGIKLTADFTGQLKILCRFDMDVFSKSSFYDIVRTAGVQLKGLHLDE